jgi:WD40 repeat protein
LSSVDVSSKQYWLAVNDKSNIRLIDSLNLCILNDLSGHTGDIECLAWSPSIDYLLASGSQDKTIRVNFFIFNFINLFIFKLVMECRNCFSIENLY